MVIRKEPVTPSPFKGIAGEIAGKETKAGTVAQQILDIEKLPVTSDEILKTANKLKIGKNRAAQIAKLQKSRELGYFPRFSGEETKEFLRNATDNSGKKIWNVKIKNALGRKTGDYTLEEWNALVKNLGLEKHGIKPEQIQSFFMKDPAYALTVRKVKSVEGITSAQFLERAGRIFGNKAGGIGVELPESVIKSMPKLKGIKFDPDIMKEITKSYDYLIKPEPVNQLIKKVFDPVQNWWKAHVLSYFPAYHSRNMAGNIFNNSLAGVYKASRYSDAIQLQVYRYYKRRGIKMPKPKLVSGLDPDFLIEQGQKLGIAGRGMMGFEIPRTIRQELAKGNWNILSSQGKLVKGGRTVGTVIEDNGRWAHFIDKIAKGEKTWDAAKSVKKFLFDYGELTEFERIVMKRIFPFYTWTRKNIPLQLEQAIKQPGKVAALQKVKSSIEAKTPITEQEKVLPKWLSERMPLRIGRDDKDIQYLPLEGYLPFSDLGKLERPGRTAIESLTPLAKIPAELSFNQSSFFGSPIERFPGEKVPFLGKDVPAKVAHTARSIRILSEIDRYVPKKDRRFGQPELSTGEKVARTVTGIKFERVNPRMQKIFSLFESNDTLKNMKAGYRRAMRRGRLSEANRIKKDMIRILHKRRKKK